jgi:pimeloyl-ACP methyl ester carboxylesterase
MPRRPVLFLTALVMLSVANGCAFFAKAPIEVLRYESGRGRPEENLLVFVRGLGGSHRSFAEEGLVADVQARGLPFDMAAPNAHFAYYAARNLLVRLKADVIDPARAAGYRRIYLVGVSMGGLGSLLYAEEHPDDIAGIFLIAPFLGYERIIAEIQAAGGAAGWQPGPYDPDEDWERMIWHWLQASYAGGSASGTPLFLAYGEADDYVEGQRLLADILPRDHVYRVDGGHDYATFRRLWDRFLEAGFFPAP